MVFIEKLIVNAVGEDMIRFYHGTRHYHVHEPPPPSTSHLN